MKSSLLGGFAIATTLLIQSAPASSQGVYRAGHPRASHSYAGHGYAGRGPARYQHRGYYAGGQNQGYGIGAGVAAVATGALIGGAIASQNQGYYPQGATTPLRLILSIRIRDTGMTTPHRRCITMAVP